MKKTLLLSVVASTLIMAGGDIEPVAVPVVEEVVSGWDFSGQAVLYYQATDWKNADLFDQAGARANAGLQLRAVNKDIFAGIGAGVEVSGLATLGLENDVVGNVMQAGNDSNARGGWISQSYLTYGFGNTSFKIGRQELPKSLSPFAFSEGWNVFKNTFDAALVVNTDITDTTLVYAWVKSGNSNGVATDMSDYNKFNGHDGIHMLTAQNKSVENLTVTGSYYYAADYGDNNLGTVEGNDAHILWGDAKYNAGSFNVAGQIGTVIDDDFTIVNGMRSDDNTIAWGLKAGGNFGMFDASLAYSSVNDGGLGVFNVGGVKTPLYTQMILNQNMINYDSDTVVVRAGVKALGGKFGLAYAFAQANRMVTHPTAITLDEVEYSELDLTYKTKIFNDSTTLFVGYVYQGLGNDVTWSGADAVGPFKEDTRNLVRVWGRYNF